MTTRTFQALIVEEAADGRYVRKVGQRSLQDLPDGDVLIEVTYSSLNYKDALSATGHKGVTRKYPHTPGVDAAGCVAESASDEFRSGDEVLVTGYDLGMNTPGGFGQYIRVPAGWIVRRPDGLTLFETMAYGTAGFTAALSVTRLQRAGVTPDQGQILVTGATGGVGSIAVAILAKLGYQVVAATGKADEHEFLRTLGATTVIPRSEVDDTSGRPLSTARWAGVVDTVGGNPLATAIKSTKYGGVVTCCGLVASPELPTTVYPFILRSVSLLGVDSVNCPRDTRLAVWQNLAREWKPAQLGAITRTCPLDELDAEIDRILAGKMRGRLVVSLSQ